MAKIFDGRLYVHYGQAYVESYEPNELYMEDCFRGQINGLCGAAVPGMLFLFTGLHTGDVGFTVDVLGSPPAIDAIWEEIVEVSFVPSSSEVMVRDWNGERVCDLPLSQETYRVRYCVRNMDRGREIDTLLKGKPLVDFYALTFWRADPAPDVIIKQTSANAAYWHDWVQTLKL